MITANKMPTQFELKQYAYASDLKSRALNVLLYLVDRTNKELTCFPSIATIGKQLHISVSTVKRAMKELLLKGFLERVARFSEKKNGGQTSNLYTLSIPQEVLPQEDKSKVYSVGIVGEMLLIEAEVAYTVSQKQEIQYIEKEVKYISFTTLLNEKLQYEPPLYQGIIKEIEAEHVEINKLQKKQGNTKFVIRKMISKVKYHIRKVFRQEDSKLKTSNLQHLDGGGVQFDSPLNLSV